MNINDNEEVPMNAEDAAFIEKMADDLADSIEAESEVEGEGACELIALATYLSGYLYGSNDGYQKIADHNPELAWDFAYNAALSQSICTIPGAAIINHSSAPVFFIGPFLRWLVKNLGKRAAKKWLKKWLKKRLKKWLAAWAKNGWKGLWGKLKKKLPVWILEMFGITIILAIIEELLAEEGENLNDNQKKKLKWIKEQLEQGNLTPKDAADMIENLLK